MFDTSLSSLVEARILRNGDMMKIVGKSSASLAGVILLATGKSMAAGFYLTQVGTPMSIGTVGVTNTVNTWGADAAWTQPAGMVDLEDDSVGVTGLSVLLAKIEFDSSVAEAGGSDGGNAGDPYSGGQYTYLQKPTRS